jgi:signal transduction histidine kinase
MGDVRELPASIDLSAYRIIQEALTNVVKHAQASRCDVLLDYGDDELRIEITDSGAGVPALAGAVPAQGSGTGHRAANHGSAWGGSGHGIIGMRERVSLLGGSFSAGPMAGYGFQVAARIPLARGAA